MGSEAKICKLGDIVDFRNGAGIKQTFFTEDLSGIPLAKVSNFTSNSIDTSEMTRVDAEHAKKWTSHHLKFEDIVIATVGSWPPNWSSVVGKVIRVPSNAVGSIQNQNTCCVIPSAAVHHGYLYYLLKDRTFLEWVVNVAQGSANQARIPVKKLGEYEVILPSMPIQIQISHILSSFDQKITLNRQINQTLEQMAQTLFKSWFVDFDPVIDNALAAGNPIPDELQDRAALRQALRESDTAGQYQPLPESVRALFPDGFEESELGWVPKGWGVSDLNAITNILSGFAFKSKDFTDEGLGVIKIKNIGKDKSIDINDTQKINHSLAESSLKFRLQDGDLLMAMTGATVGKVGFLVTRSGEPYFLNQRVAKLEPKDNGSAFLYCALSISEEYVVNQAQGSAQPNISAKAIGSMPMVLPASRLRDAFNENLQSSFQQIIQLQKETMTLTALRDTLLPKLISGELQLDQLPDAVTSVV